MIVTVIDAAPCILQIFQLRVMKKSKSLIDHYNQNTDSELYNNYIIILKSLCITGQ